MKISIRITRQTNADMLGVNAGAVIEMDMEEYLKGVVPSEIGNAHLQACKAQAIAARTYAWRKKTITDSSSSDQAFRAERMHDTKYENAHRAVEETAGMVLTYDGDVINTCSYSASNGGRTTSSEERWGGFRPWLIAKDDPWDLAATGGKKTGHGVGMSQKGAIYAANNGISFEEILSFYYPGCVLQQKEESIMASVKASDLVKDFQLMLSEHWKYVAGGSRKGAVDCSGAFSYWYKQHGGYMYHGSNTMYRKYTVEKGKIGEIDLVPGMAVFKCRKWTTSQSNNGWYNTSPGDLYHVGLYIGDNTVIEAKGTKYGVVSSNLSTWTYAAKLKNTIYDITNQQQIQQNTASSEKFPFVGTVKLNSGYLNLRLGPSKSYRYFEKAYDGDQLTITGETGNWYILDYNNRTLYASKDYIVNTALQDQSCVFIVQADNYMQKEELKRILSKYSYRIEENGTSAA